ncbi:aspartate--tRNA ligase, partial [Candidatus Sumerlaeota bacterium]|nr:aspartate--tRNA ligase [Candidatus Sumerlaeota bacterium]
MGQDIVLKGWVHSRRDHGSIIFIDLRDRAGLCQVELDPKNMDKEEFLHAHALRSEFVIAVQGKVRERPEGTVNPKLPTGEVELKADHFEILNPSAPLPFKIDEYAHVGEETRLRYRYLDLRRPEMQKIIITRSTLYRIVRNFLHDNGFIEIDTPILTKSTPEGARDFLVPSRLSPGHFYALPQSPQLFKQILMVAGYDKYFQIARCFRDEDFRANRQPDFTQIDIEMSFVTPEDIFEPMERLCKAIFEGILERPVTIPFRRIPYAEAMLKYGSDKPDLRFDLEIRDVSEVFKTGCEFKVFNEILEKGGVIRALCVPGGAAKISNTQLKPGGALPKVASDFGAKGLAWFKMEGEPATPTSTITKFFAPETLSALAEKTEARAGDLIMIVSDKEKVAATVMGQLRLWLGNELALIDPDALEFAWIVDFPLLEYDDREKRWSPAHHPFTSPMPEDIPLLETDPGKVRARAYDLALNGEEIAGGSIRIHSSDVQEKAFKAIGITSEQAMAKFGFLLEALSFGAPPHGGIAFGVDRLMMILMKRDSIRDVIPFPKTQTGLCLMTHAPSD